MAILFVILPYLYNVAQRSGAHECERETFEEYIGERCTLPREYGTIFRLYHAGTHELLVERTYLDPNLKPLIWHKTDVLYDVNADDGYGFVTLPPTLLDRLRAKLP
ncbi:hypothetical protein LMG23992_01765 [Cupriavidus laharis]|uniref:DUF3304 domain-containing protein n=1 Tax=Cupriavidus laharis TaxID=151654 RepID=A0ABM8WTD8_9BURK|nr:hypothetical protein LMG23992_01765 [Cupriavidus laharis]